MEEQRIENDRSALKNRVEAGTSRLHLPRSTTSLPLRPCILIFIKAAMRNSSSVLMAEAGALALVAVLLKQIQLHHTTLLSDNQQLVHFLNGSDLSHPPDWRMKPYTQIISSTLSGTTTAIRKITRTQNQMADLLARQALRDLHSNPHSFSGVCTHSAHVQECPLLMALQNVTINSVMVLTASCC